MGAGLWVLFLFYFFEYHKTGIIYFDFIWTEEGKNLYNNLVLL